MRASVAIWGLMVLLGGCKQTPEQAPGAEAEARSKPVADPVPDPTGAPIGEPSGAAVGAHASQQCTDLLEVFGGLEHPTGSIEVAQITAQLAGPLDWAEQADRSLARVSADRAQDRARIEALLAAMPAHDQAARAVDLVVITTQLRVVALLEMRRLLAEVADDHLRGAAAVEAWDEAYCIWNAGLRTLAARAEPWEASIAAAFAQGHAQLGHGDEPTDPAKLKAAKQQIEKGMYAVAYQLILADAESRSAAGASEALGLLDALEDRLADRNSPGLARMRVMLDGPADQFDAKLIERELAVAFTKRARKYCDKAVVNAELGTPQAVAETWEGIIYTRVILASMGKALTPTGFDADAYAVDWEDYVEAVEASDAELAAEISARLVEWNCAYQRQLGIAECTSSTDERE